MSTTSNLMLKPDPPYVDLARSLLTQSTHTDAEVRRAEDSVRLLDMWRMRPQVQAAAFLLPIVRRQPPQLDEELARSVNSRVVALARIVSRLMFNDATVEYGPQSDTKRRIERKRRLYKWAFQDRDVVLLVVATRIASIADVEKMSDIEKRAWAQENIDVYLPLLEMLGLWQHRRELGNHSLMIHNSSNYRQILRGIEAFREQNQRTFDNIARIMYDSFEEQSISSALISMHEFTPISIQQRIEQARRRGVKVTIDEVSNLCVDILVETTRDCYHALGVVHSRWRPTHRASGHKERRFYDYIAAPRYNGYRCLITTVLYRDPDDPRFTTLVEFRIRTQSMEQINTQGIVAALQMTSSARGAWWYDTAARDILRSSTEKLKIPQEIAVFTPIGEVIYPLPKGSTVVDAAFHVHTQIAPYARRFILNGDEVRFDHPLKNGDLIEVDFDLQVPSLEPAWEEYARTNVARDAIKRFLKQMNRAPHRGRQAIDAVLEREMTIYQMRFPTEKVEDHLRRIARFHKLPSLDMLYMRVLDGQLAPDEIVATMVELELAPFIGMADGSAFPTERISFSRAWMNEPGSRKMDAKIRIMPGVEIVGRLTSSDNNARLIVHRADSPHCPKGKNVVPLVWRGTATQREVAEITITAPPRSYALEMTLNNIRQSSQDDENQRINIQECHSSELAGSTRIDLRIDAPSMEHIRKIHTLLGGMQRSGYINHFQVWQLFPGQRVLLAGRADKRYRNPYTLRQVRDQSMFFGREAEIDQVIDYVQQGQNLILIIGQQRIGKSSLLYHLAEHRLPQAARVMPVQFDAQSLAPFTTIQFLLGLADETAKRLTERIKRPEERRTLRLREKDLTTDPFRQFAQWVKHIEERLQGTKLMFIVDEFTRVERELQSGLLEVGFLNGMHYLTETAQVGFILCVHDYVHTDSSQGWSLYQRGQPIRLGTLERAAAQHLIRSPQEQYYHFEDGVIDYILDVTACHPFFIQGICQTMMSSMAQNPSTLIDREMAIRATMYLIREGKHFFHHFWALAQGIDHETLHAVARLTTKDAWTTSDQIRQQLKQYNITVTSYEVAKSIGDLKNQKLLEAADIGGQARYRIPIPIFAHWLRDEATGPFVRHDLYTKENPE